jgi:hypothetical protein
MSVEKAVHSPYAKMSNREASVILQDLYKIFSFTIFHLFIS